MAGRPLAHYFVVDCQMKAVQVGPRSLIGTVVIQKMEFKGGGLKLFNQRSTPP